ncbi:hypothetical protein DFP93_11297 [Aneurinibacillus soli]|uniref:Uncharacterized protein n=1 Tax=Aneurinibacillus soli TaxID=1500254 RepID=A0A0U4WNI8_9BACL|nr:hypothetical protein [Aneurinibacillus soli]PYE60657.1 hypothetical protein DFP93_11297 [Aneurinibacillus soli]BAU29819.1 hypothetical protein CB4_04073 [Aneurinibacillus soli]
MNCFCEGGETNDLKIEGDIGADPVWCNKCGCNLNIEDIPISSELANELLSWAMKYGEWIDWDIDKWVPNGIELENSFNQMGIILCEKVRQELGDKYKVIYLPSASIH